MLGFMLGSFTFGNVSDRWGRKKTFMLCSVVYLMLGTISIFSPNISVFLVLKILLGSVVSGSFYTVYVLLIESTDPSKRVLMGTSILIFFPTGYLISSFLGYLSTSWQRLQLLYTMFGLPVLLYFWILPESPRWLISKNKLSEAKKVICAVAKENKITLLEEKLNPLLVDACKDLKQQVSIANAMRYPHMRLRIFILMFLSMTSFMSFFGVTWNVASLSGNLYVNVALMGLADLPGFLVVIGVAQKFGRRPVVIGFLVLAGGSFLMMLLKQADETWTLAWTLISKLILGAMINVSYAYSSEIYPTQLRNAGLGFNVTAASIGGMVAPYVFYLSIVWKPLPNVIFAALLLISGCACLALPETFGKKLPETLEEGEAFQR